MNLGNLSRLSAAETRSISSENTTGSKGGGARATEGTGANAARDLGKGWKVSPCNRIEAGETLTLADIEGSGAIQQIWMTPTGQWRHTIMRIYWDDQEQPSVECPVGDFFGFAVAASGDTMVSLLGVASSPILAGGKIYFFNQDGKATEYQIGYSATPITPASWSGCTKLSSCPTPTPR